MSKPNGIILYEGPSAIDGSPIFVVATGIHKASRGNRKGTNAKTGAMVQVYILQQNVNPLDASASGADSAICGDCKHRGIANGEKAVGRSCYVVLMHGPTAVWKAYQRGSYPRYDLADAADLLEGLPIRFGSYGDPGAVPEEALVWQTLHATASVVTGYTHRWLDSGAYLNGLVMASADSVEEAGRARALEFATFRVSPLGDKTRLRGEAICPASAEAGKVVQCVSCPIPCNGSTNYLVKGRVIQAHGVGQKHVRA